MDNEYKAFLICKGHKLSTVNDYVGRVEHVIKNEGIMWPQLAANIGLYVAMYDIGGAKEKEGAKSHNAVICALKAFREMVKPGVSKSVVLPSSSSTRTPNKSECRPVTFYDVDSVFDFINEITNLYPHNPTVFEMIRSEVVFFEDDIFKPYRGTCIDKKYEIAQLLAELLKQGVDDDIINEQISDILKPNTNINIDEAIKRLAGIVDYHRSVGEKTVADIIERICEIAKTSFYFIGGTYNHEEKLITLYLKNITTKIEKKITIAHELFHAYHHFLIDIIGEHPFDCDNYKIVLESLASYFEYRYAEEHRQKGHANSLRSSWYKNSIASYPYAGAKNIRDDGYFLDVLFTSIRSMKAALYMLLN